MQKLIYLASPYSSEHQAQINARVAAVQIATAKLIEQGHLIFSPIVHTHPIADQVSFSPVNTDGAMSGWMKYDYAMIDKCDELWILMLPGWEKSRGVSAETQHALAAKKTIRYIEYPTLKDRGHIKTIQTNADPAKFVEHRSGRGLLEQRSSTWDTPSTGKAKDDIVSEAKFVCVECSNTTEVTGVRCSNCVAQDKPKQTSVTVGEAHPTIPEYNLAKIYESGSLLYTRKVKPLTSEQSNAILDRIFGDKPKKKGKVTERNPSGYEIGDNNFDDRDYICIGITDGYPLFQKFPPETPKQTTSLPDDAAERSTYPMAEGLLYYFANALAEVSKISRIGNEQHNAGQPMHWSRGKSTEHADKIIRHLIDAGQDTEASIVHAANLAWRSLALLQEKIERVRNVPMPKNCWVDTDEK